MHNEEDVLARIAAEVEQRMKTSFSPLDLAGFLSVPTHHKIRGLLHRVSFFLNPNLENIYLVYF
jgi:hypothetical protein